MCRPCVGTPQSSESECSKGTSQFSSDVAGLARAEGLLYGTGALRYCVSCRCERTVGEAEGWAYDADGGYYLSASIVDGRGHCGDAWLHGV